METARPRFPKLALGRPLLDSPEDACALGKILSDRYQPEPGRAVVLLGHGGGEDVQQTYGQLEAALQDLGREDMLVGTLLGEPGLPQVMERLEAGGFRQVRLTPLLVAAGNHALRNMAGEEADSWQSALTRGGFQVRCSLHGLGRTPRSSSSSSAGCWRPWRSWRRPDRSCNIKIERRPGRCRGAFSWITGENREKLSYQNMPQAAGSTGGMV